MEIFAMEHHIYRLVPVAPTDDPNWDLATNQGEVVVRALSSGDARIVAAHAEAAAIIHRPPLATTQIFASAFRDEKLYHVVEDTSGEFPADGPRTVLRANFHVPEGYVPAAD
jgi:hypothetical protein